MSLPARLLQALLRGYQRAAAGRPSPCRYLPTCSVYAAEAIDEHGAFKGSWYAARRLARCHPWGRSGHDPVPEPGARKAGVTPHPTLPPPAALAECGPAVQHAGGGER